MSTLDRIKQGGTVVGYKCEGRPSGQITCVDGFTLSVQAGSGMYCTPRVGGTADASYAGPYTAAEVGFPSERPEPWAEWVEFCENPEYPTETVYGYVPFELIEALITSHGGERA